METTQINSKWQQKQEVIKGNMGEKIIYELLRKKGWIVYKTIMEGGHCFDFLATKDRKELLIVEVKTKPKRLKYPDTGFNLRHYNEYKRISEKHNLKVFVAFVDESEGRIYGNYLNELEKPKTITANGKQITYPLIYSPYGNETGTVYFPVENMVTIASLRNEDIANLKAHSTRNSKYDYSGI